MLSKSEQKWKPLPWDDLDDLLSDLLEEKPKTPASGTKAALERGLADLLGELDEIPSRTPRTAPATPGLRPTIAGQIAPWDMNTPVAPSHSFLIGEGGSGILPLGSTTVFAAPGGYMKTALAYSIAVHAAAAKPWADMPVRESCTLLLVLEDDRDEAIRRLIYTTRTQIEPDRHSVVPQRVRIVALAGIDARLTVKVGSVSHRGSVVDQIIDAVKALVVDCEVPAGLVVIDHARLAIGGDSNDSGDVTELTRATAQIAKHTGAAVLLLCHSPKSTVNPKHPGEYTSADVNGSGAFVDNSRQAAVITTLIDKERKDFSLTEEVAKRHLALRIIKSNYSETGRVIYLRKTPVDGCGVAVPDVVTLTRPVREVVTPASTADKVLNYIRANPGRFTKTAFKTQAGLDGPMSMGVSAATVNLDALIKSGRVVLRAPTVVEIQLHSLGRQAKEVLYAPE